jgi:hypothetical protein
VNPKSPKVEPMRGAKNEAHSLFSGMAQTAYGVQGDAMEKEGGILS